MTVGMSNVEIMADAAILLFLNDVDEKLFETLTKIFPTWMKEINECIHQMYSDNSLDSLPRNRVDTIQRIHSKEQKSNEDNLSEDIFSTTRDISENELLRRQVEQLQKQVNILSSTILKIRPDLASELKVDKYKCAEKRIKSDVLNIETNFEHKINFQDQERLQKKNDQKGKKGKGLVSETSLRAERKVETT